MSYTNAVGYPCAACTRGHTTKVAMTYIESAVSFAFIVHGVVTSELQPQSYKHTLCRACAIDPEREYDGGTVDSRYGRAG